MGASNAGPTARSADESTLPSARRVAASRFPTQFGDVSTASGGSCPDRS